MRRIISVLAALSVMAALVAASALPLAAQSQGQGEGAVVIDEFGCFTFLPPAPPVFSNDKTHAVITPSGNTKLTCHFEGPPIAETVVAKDFGCLTFLGGTTESHFVYTKSGKGTLTCHVNPGS